jgi:hypothetical protein
MARYGVGSVSSSGADAGEAFATLWNPHGSIALRVVKVTAVLNVATATVFGLIRATAQGTPANTATPDTDSHFGRRADPVSGAVANRGNYTVNPTFSGGYLARIPWASTGNQAIEWWFPVPIIVPGGTGLSLVSTIAVGNTHAAWEWEE